MLTTALVRYGAIAEVARCAADSAALARGRKVVVQTHRGIEVGTFLECVPGEPSRQHKVLRETDDADEARARELARECNDEFGAWRARFDEWQINLELIDLEWTLDRTALILYVLNDQGRECARLEVEAAAAGLGLVIVQPVDETGPILITADPERECKGGCSTGEGGGCGSGGGGCGSGGCGSSGGGCHT